MRYPESKQSDSVELVDDQALIDLVPREFVLAMGKILSDGVKEGRTLDDWQELSPEAAEAKIFPLLRHVGKKQFDATACNAMIMWWHFQREKTA